MTRNKIYIVGKGAIGKALAVFLKRKGKDVILVRGSVSEQPTAMEHLTVTLNDGTKVEEDVEVTTLGSTGTLNGIVVLTNKSFGNAELASKLRDKISVSPVVLLQNGLGVERPFIEHNFTSVYRCVLFVTSQNLNNNEVRFKPVSTCPIGIVKGDSLELKHICETLSTDHFQFKSEPDIELVVWRKAVINCAFNSICPLLEIDNGIFHRDVKALALARRVVKECIGIALKRGVVLQIEQVMENLLLISRSSDGQLISTLQDIHNHQPTEIDTLNLEVARIANELGMGETVRETRLLGELTKLKADLSLNSK